jgi:hypothetical protein
VHAEQVDLWRIHGPSCSRQQVCLVHPELSGTVVTHQPNPFKAPSGGDGSAQEDRHAVASSPRELDHAVQLAGRLDGDGAQPRRDCRLKLVVPLAGARHHDRAARDPRSSNRC